MLIWLLQQRRSKEEKCGYYMIKGVIAAADCVLAVFCLCLGCLCGNHLCLVWSSKLLSRWCPAQHKGVCITTRGARTLRSGLRNYRQWLKFWDLGVFFHMKETFIFIKHTCVIESCLWVIPCGPKNLVRNRLLIVWSEIASDESSNIWQKKKIKICFVMCKLLEIRKKSKENYSIYQRVNTFYFDNRRQETYIRWHFISIVNFSTPWKQLEPQPHQSELGITSRKWSFVIHPLRSKNPKVLLPIPSSLNKSCWCVWNPCSAFL